MVWSVLSIQVSHETQLDIFHLSSPPLWPPSWPASGWPSGPWSPCVFLPAEPAAWRQQTYAPSSRRVSSLRPAPPPSASAPRSGGREASVTSSYVKPTGFRIKYSLQRITESLRWCSKTMFHLQLQHLLTSTYLFNYSEYFFTVSSLNTTGVFFMHYTHETLQYNFELPEWLRKCLNLT